MKSESAKPEEKSSAKSSEASSETAGETPAPSQPKTSSELKEALERNEELVTRLKYLQADFENYRKRAARETEALVRLANEALVARLLSVLDDFDAALAHLDGEAAKGMHMVHENLMKALQAAGLEEIPAEGKPFDPYLHDCVQQVEDPEFKEGVVKEVIRKGYRLEDRILRPAQVVVVRNGGEPNA